MENRKKIIIGIVIALVIIGGYFLFKKKPVKKINLAGQQQGPLNTGPVSPISGLSCDNWNKRAVAVMQPVDRQARPTAGFSQADMVFEMPNPAEGIFVTRLMGVYLCNLPEEIGAIRSARHDWIAIAKGLDAVFVGWGGSAFAIEKLNQNTIDNIDCNGQGGKKAPQCCFRKEATGLMRAEDTGFVKGAKIAECAKEFDYRQEGKFSGYPHQADAPEDQRPNDGRLRIGYPGMMEVEYDYDKASNSYLRTWGGVEDTDRNNGQRLAPKNVVVMTVENEQIMNSVDYVSRGTQDPWAGLPEEEKTGPTNISGRYNNLQIGDPWFDTTDNGQASFYFNGQEVRGTWKKDKSSADSKLTFFDESGNEIQFVPGLIWVEVMVPGQNFKWVSVA